MRTLPKRKLRLWYNKNDYLKERENEKTQLDQAKTDNAPEAVLTAEKTESTGNDNIRPAAENTEIQLVKDETKLPQAETQNEILQTDLKATENEVEMHPTSTNIQEQVSNNENNAQIEPNKEIESTQDQSEQTSSENDSKPQPTEKEIEQTSIQTDNNVPSVSLEEKQAVVELKPVSDQDKLVEPLSLTNPEQVTTPVEVIKEATSVETENKVPLTANVVNIGKYVDSLKRLLPTKAVVCIGEYPINIVLKGSLAGKRNDGVLPIFVEKSTKDVIKWSQGQLDKTNIVCLDEDIDTHFWFDILPYFVDNGSFFARIKSKPIEKLQGAIIVSSTWNGIGSALLPSLNAQFKEWNINSVALPLLPSKAQPLDGQFNSFASFGILASKRIHHTFTIERDNLESYSGVDRNGFRH